MHTLRTCDVRPLTSFVRPPAARAVYKKEVPLAEAKAINGLRAVFGEVGASASEQ